MDETPTDAPPPGIDDGAGRDRRVSAYILADVEITEPTPFAEYRRRVDAIIAQYGGRILVAGGAVAALEGNWRPARLIILEFPSRADARRWYASPEYVTILPLRLRHATTHWLSLVAGDCGA